MEKDGVLDRPKFGECRSFSGGSAICGAACKKGGVSQMDNWERIPEKGNNITKDVDEKEYGELRRKE